MQKKVQLTLIGRQRDEFGEETVTETTATAEYYKKNGLHYIFYEEPVEGTGAVIKNTIKLKSSVLELTKKGLVTARMVFEPGREHMTDYATPYGCLQMGILTRTVEADFKDDLPQISAEYSLTSGESLISHCTITIKLK